MKTNLLRSLILSALMISALFSANAQCAYDNTLAVEGDAPSPLGTTVTASNVWGGDMVRMDNAVGGNTYAISFCNSYYWFDSQITIYPAGGGNPIAFDDDGCGYYGGPSYIEFTPAQDGSYDILLDEWDCINSSYGMDMEVTLIAEGGGSGGNGGGGTAGGGGTPADVTIPVVVHVLYNNADQNISDQQIQNEIVALNHDYRWTNTDFGDIVPTAFESLAADFKIEFKLATEDPNGNPTDGITRTQTSVTEFHAADNGAKHAGSGGENNWDPFHYLNFWVCNLADGLLGYATFPTDLQSDPSNDGVVILYTAFGTGGAVTGPYDRGRTATHEAGHWMNLRHVWGDANCGDDFVDDTPTQQQANYGCPTFPHVTCSNGPNGDMFVNYMDYVDDGCMGMFTLGQKQRVWGTLNTLRSGLLNSNVGIEEVASEQLNIYPNPTNGSFRVTVQNGLFKQPVIEVYNAIGMKMNTTSSFVTGSSVDIQMDNTAAGLYFITLKENGKRWTGSLMVQ